jgi:hypothetical protein
MLGGAALELKIAILQYRYVGLSHPKVQRKTPTVFESAGRNRDSRQSDGPGRREWRTNRAAIRERNAALASYWDMQWIEALINISALAGFVGVANLGQKMFGRGGRRSNGSKLEWSD